MRFIVAILIVTSVFVIYPGFSSIMHDTGGSFIPNGLDSDYLEENPVHMAGLADTAYKYPGFGPWTDLPDVPFEGSITAPCTSCTPDDWLIREREKQTAIGSIFIRHWLDPSAPDIPVTDNYLISCGSCGDSLPA